jgi:hypothetical protein
MRWVSAAASTHPTPAEFAPLSKMVSGLETNFN